MSTSSIKLQIRRFHVVVVQWTSKKCTKKRDARAELLFWSLIVLFFEVVVERRRRSCLSSLMSLSKDVFGRGTSTGSESFSLLICLDATKLVKLSIFTVVETICQKSWAKSLPKYAKHPLPVDVLCSKTFQFAQAPYCRRRFFINFEGH